VMIKENCSKRGWWDAPAFDDAFHGDFLPSLDRNMRDAQKFEPRSPLQLPRV